MKADTIDAVNGADLDYGGPGLFVTTGFPFNLTTRSVF